MNFFNKFIKIDQKKVYFTNYISQRLKTIYALSSGPLPAAIAVVRISGPKTFTGEDCAELYLHGSKAILNTVFKTLSKINGLESAKAGEFTKRAFYNNKMNVLEVESLSNLINAETENQRLLSMRIADNGKYLKPIRENLVNLAARLEAHIDFGEEMADGATIQENELLNESRFIQKKLTIMLRRAQRGCLIRSGLNVTLVGKTNVGKSSIMNRLAEKDVSIVSNYPGTTRDSVELRLQLNSTLINVIDTAGFRITDNLIEKEGIRRSLMRAEEANIIILISDQHNFELAKNEIIFLLKKIKFNPLHQRLIICFNKFDLVDDASKQLNKKNIKNLIFDENLKALMPAVVWTSCLTEDGLQNLIEELTLLIKKEFSLNSLLTESGVEGCELVISSNRHLELLERSLNEINEFEKNLSVDNDLALAAQNLRNSANWIGEISGKIVNQEILDKILSTMCIGK